LHTRIRTHRGGGRGQGEKLIRGTSTKGHRPKIVPRGKKNGPGGRPLRGRPRRTRGSSQKTDERERVPKQRRVSIQEERRQTAKTKTDRRKEKGQ